MKQELGPVPEDLEPWLGNTILARLAFSSNADFNDPGFLRAIDSARQVLMVGWGKREIPVETIRNRLQNWLIGTTENLSWPENKPYAGVFGDIGSPLGQKILATLYLTMWEIAGTEINPQLLEIHLESVISPYLTQFSRKDSVEKGLGCQSVKDYLIRRLMAAYSLAGNTFGRQQALPGTNSLAAIDPYETPPPPTGGAESISELEGPIWEFVKNNLDLSSLE